MLLVRAAAVAAAAPASIVRARPVPPTLLRNRRTVAAAAATAAMEKVEFGPSKLPGYEAGPKNAPAVIVLQEWWGVTDIIKDQALLISKEGPFRVLVPDLYKGKLGVDAEEASHLMGNLDFKAAVKEIGEAASYLRATGSPKVGVTGFCMGGALTLAAAQHAGVDCAAPFYGIPSPEICQPGEIKVPVQAHFGALDALEGFSDPKAAAALADTMRAAAAAEFELFMYDGAGHAFMNALTPAGRDKIATIGAASPPDEQVQAAFARLSAFLKKHLL